MDYEYLPLNQPVVFDNGSGTIKAGFAGEEQPKTFFPSYVGRPKHTRIMAGALEGETFIGNKAQEVRGLLKIRYPMEHGIVTDWDDMERIWQFIYNDDLKILPEEHPVLLTEAPINPRSNRQCCAEIFFETFNVPALYISIQAVLALYSTGRTTGVVLDSGDGVTHSVPVYEGFAIPNAIQRIDIAGRDVTEYLQHLLRKSGTILSTSAEKEIVRNIKEKHCYLSLDSRREEIDWATSASSANNTSNNYRLPDGKIIKLGDERFKASEILFNPDIIGSEFNGVHQLILDSVMKSDIDLRPNLFSSIILSGGSTLTKGFGDRLLQELRKVAPKDTKIKIYAPPERKYSTWIGGSILAGLSTFKKMWISSESYNENPDLIHKRSM
ncbi:actin-2 [Nadsonia fulvescens var. elongata DSM 6958]|uniref:Centractin n=1 Tax=Nadsonia fulvescens var. elongata DSM 6958 TaxID=857566 RepID=A0A1E3PH33_9ASCO|nr:actin-2 [Nadsonia fulvescens var. elongata DSM 6958]